MNAVIDSGNTAAKVAIFDHQTLTEKFVLKDEEALQKFLAGRQFGNMIVSSVNIPAEKILGWARVAEKKYTLVPGLPLPVTVMYKTPHTLGVDRIAAACGAWQLFPLENSLVIDAGTCITYEFVDETGKYHGGGIAPGLHMRFKAMNNFTARLPLIPPVQAPPLVGNTTETSMQSGVVNGMVAEMEGIIARYDERFPGLRVILCGGDTSFFENQVKASIFASPELVLVGLNSILSHNVHL
jgi:type III pantothenate kinase